MVYVTQEAAEPHYRNFRGFSVNDNYDAFGLRESYGEFVYRREATQAELDAAPVYQPNTFIQADSAHVGGWQRGAGQSYYFSDGYGWFIESEIKVTEYRFRDLIPAS